MASATAPPPAKGLGERLFKLFTSAHIALYRRTGGAIGGKMRGMPVLLLTTTGRKSGQQRTVPLMYLTDGPNYVITASNSGRDRAPAWWLNLQSGPRATIQVGRQVLEIVAEQATPEEKQRLWPALTSRAPFYDVYRQRTSRDIPMVILRPATPS